jgi:hypothetical protein
MPRYGRPKARLSRRRMNCDRRSGDSARRSAKEPRKGNFTATVVAQTLSLAAPSLPGCGSVPDVSALREASCQEGRDSL